MIDDFIKDMWVEPLTNNKAKTVFDDFIRLEF